MATVRKKGEPMSSLAPSSPSADNTKGHCMYPHHGEDEGKSDSMSMSMSMSKSKNDG